MADQPNEDLNICCPYCGGEFYIETRSEGSGYLTYDVPDSIECSGTENWCGAVWERNGVLRTKPNYLLYPDLYSRSEQ